MNRTESGRFPSVFSAQEGKTLLSPSLPRSLFIHSLRIPMEGYLEASVRSIELFEEEFERQGIDFPEVTGEEFEAHIEHSYLRKKDDRGHIDWPAAVKHTLTTIDRIGADAPLKKEIDMLVGKRQNDLGYMMGMSDMYRIYQDLLEGAIEIRSLQAASDPTPVFG